MSAYIPNNAIEGKKGDEANLYWACERWVSVYTLESKLADLGSKRENRADLNTQDSWRTKSGFIWIYCQLCSWGIPLWAPLTPPHGIHSPISTLFCPYSCRLSYKVLTRELDKVEGHPAIIGCCQSKLWEEFVTTHMRGKRCQSHFLLILAFISSVISPSQPATKAAASSTSWSWTWCASSLIAGNTLTSTAAPPTFFSSSKCLLSDMVVD